MKKLFRISSTVMFIAAAAIATPALAIPAPVPPVPEPETWMMMILGFGIAGASMRRVATRAKRIATRKAVRPN
jgi:hypothetical protein